MRFSKPSPPPPAPADESTVMGTFSVPPPMMSPTLDEGPRPLSGGPPPLPSAAPPGAGSITVTPVASAWVRIWLRAQAAREFQSLAVLASSPQFPDASLHVAKHLARVSEELGQPLVVLDGRNLALPDLVPTKGRLRALAQSGQRVILALTLPQQNPLAVPVAQSVDAALIGVFLGESKGIVCQQAIEQVGRRKFVGSVVLTTATRSP